MQKHAATRLHWDFRLEWRGVLLSWAVTRGPSDDPSQKRLAVRTEDHPLDYADFEGTIAPGNYGAGEVMLWDRGTWAPLPGEDVDEGLAEGKLKFTLAGERMTGGWTLVRMKPRSAADAKRENWLLIKERDEAASDEPERLVERYVTSVRTATKTRMPPKAPKHATPSGRAASAPARLCGTAAGHARLGLARRGGVVVRGQAGRISRADRPRQGRTRDLQPQRGRLVGPLRATGCPGGRAALPLGADRRRGNRAQGRIFGSCSRR